MHRFFVFLATTFVLASRPAAADVWNDGSPSRLQHRCVLGLDLVNQVEDLTWTWVGFLGVPKAGEVYYMRIRIGGLGCSGVWVRPEVRLPRQTSFAIDAGHPVRCYYEINGRTQVTDGCPTSPSTGLYPYASNFFAFPPTIQPYWALPQGRILSIEFPVVSTVSMSGIQTNDYLLGAVNALDNNPGGPTVQWNGVESNWAGSVPSQGAWQGVYVASAGAPPQPRIAYPSDAVSVSIDSRTGRATATTRVRVYNSNCLLNQNMVFDLERVDCSRDPAQFLGGGCTTPDAANGSDCHADWGSLEPGRNYKWKAYFQSTAVRAGCAAPAAADASGTCSPGYTNGFVGFTAAQPPVSTRMTLLTSADAGGSVLLSPNDGVYPRSTQVTITATAQSGYTFSGWTLDGASVAGPNPYVLTMNADHQLTAHFAVTSSPSNPGNPGNPDAGSSPPTSGPSNPGNPSNPDRPTASASTHGGCAVVDPEPWLVGIVLSLLSSRRRKQKGT